MRDANHFFHFFYDFERKVRERRAKDARKTYPLEPCPAQNGLHLAMPDVPWTLLPEVGATRVSWTETAGAQQILKLWLLWASQFAQLQKKHRQVLVQGKRSNNDRADNNRYINCIVLYSSLFDLIFLIPDTHSWFWKMQPLWDRERRRKIRERFAKGGFLGTFI